jgi:hypothetical protein
MSKEFSVTNGCLAVVLGLCFFFFGIPLLLMGGCGVVVWQAAQDAKIEDNTALPVTAPTPVNTAARAKPPEIVRAEKIALAPGANVITQIPLKLMGEHGISNLPAGARVQILSVSGESAIVGTSGMSAEVAMTDLAPLPGE